MKPLVVISIPKSISESSLQSLKRGIEEGELNKEYLFLYVPTNAASTEVKVFYHKDITEKSLEELRKELISAKLIDNHKENMTILDITIQSLEFRIENLTYFDNDPQQLDYLKGILSNLKIIQNHESIF